MESLRIYHFPLIPHTASSYEAGGHHYGDFKLDLAGFVHPQIRRQGKIQRTVAATVFPVPNFQSLVQR